MTMKAFTGLSDAEQLRLIVVYGVLLAERSMVNSHIYLYAVGSFYIELFHEVDTARPTGLRVFRMFDDIKYLDEYLSCISIPQVS